jgi:hypothetical protein
MWTAPRRLDLPGANLVKYRNWSCLEIECEQLGEFLDAKRAVSHCNKLKQAMGEFPVCLIDLSQGAPICSSSVSWQVGQCMSDTCRDAAANVDHLAIHPLNLRHRNERVVKKFRLTPYIPSAFSVRTSMASCLCSFHVLFFRCVLMTNLM